MRKVITILSFALFVTSADAAPITTLFGTGLDSSGNPLAAGAIDLDYIVLETGDPAMVLEDVTHYVPNDAGSQWIWEGADGKPKNVTRTFSTTFDLTGMDPTTAVINGMWGADNFGDDILINGVSTGISLPVYGFDNFQTLHAFSITGGFQSGINTLDFVIRDVGVIAGFRTQLSGTADLLPVVGGETTDPEPTQVPEPSTLLLLATGLIAVGIRRGKHG